LGDAPADVTVEMGNWSRDDKKAIKNGTSARLFTAVSALFDVSLCFDWSDRPRTPSGGVGGEGGTSTRARVSAAFNSRETPQYGNDIFCEFVYHLLRVLGRRCVGKNILRQNQ